MAIIPRLIKPRPTWSMFDLPYPSEVNECSASTALWFRCSGNRRTYYWCEPSVPAPVCPYCTIMTADTWTDFVIGPTGTNEAILKLPWVVQKGFTNAKVSVFTCSGLSSKYAIKALVSSCVNVITETSGTTMIANDYGLALPTPGGAWRKVFPQMYMTKHDITYPTLTDPPRDLVFRVQGIIESTRMPSNVAGQEYKIYIPMIMIEEYIAQDMT